MAQQHDTYTHFAHLYDIAFSWDVDEEVEWLLARFDRPVVRLLEPACSLSCMQLRRPILPGRLAVGSGAVRSR